MDVCQSDNKLVTGGLDGRLFVLPLGADAEAATCIQDSKGMISYNCGKWVEMSIVAVVSTQRLVTFGFPAQT